MTPRPHIRTCTRWLVAGTTVLLSGWVALGGGGDKPRRAAVIPIRGVIDDIMRDSIDRRLEAAREAGVDVVIFEMDTPGGSVSSALDIFRAIERFGGHTVAWVNPEAYSAGALISVACSEIWMSRSSSIGDCAPIVMSPTGGVMELGETERAKAESPILQQFRDAAARNGYNQALSRAMVTVGQEVWWLERKDDPAVRQFVTAAEKQKLIDEAEPAEREWVLVASYKTPEGREYPVEQPVDRADSLLTMGAQDAVAFGFARGIAANVDDLAAALGVGGGILRFDPSGWERFAAWLNSPLVRGILLVLVLIGGYLEFQSPGLILPGVVAVLALAIFLAAPYAAGLQNYWPIVLLVIGLALLAVEIFVIPGFGITGITGLALMLVAILASFMPADPVPHPFAMPDLSRLWVGVLRGIQVLLGSLVVSVGGILVLVRYLPETRAAQGVLTGNPRAAELALSDAYATVAQIGDVGVVTGALRPAGQARFGHEVVDVRSQGEYVDAGRRVQVIRHDGAQIVVRPLSEERGT